MRIRLLGPVEVWASGRPARGLGTVQQRAVLAALAVNAGRPVMLETLVDRVWDEAPPAGTRPALYAHISRIRQTLQDRGEAAGQRPVGPVRRAGGYVLDIDADLVDLHQFRRLAAAAREPHHPDTERAELLREALALWQGVPLADLSSRWAARMREEWTQQRLEAVVAWAQVETRLGRHDEVIGPVRELLADHPLAEPLTGVLMRALVAAGRDAEALDRYATTRARFVQELGAEPGPELRAVHQAVLRGDLDPAALTLRPARERTGRPVPAQLPADVSRFAGRGRELADLDHVLTAPDGTDPSGTAAAVLICAVSGMAGVGKTTLAVHWSHHVRDRFPDGQLYVNLRGFDPTGSPVMPAEAMRGFLDAFEVPPGRIPAGLEAQVGLYRSLLAGRRVLVVLDNARDAEQVRPLLPGAAGCLVVVTSRDQLAGLVAADGAHPVVLGLPSHADARDLLARRLGPDRVAAEPQAVDDVITLCARLPLALSVAAARAALHPGFGLAVLADELREARARLDGLAGTDPVTDVRAVFSWSYQQLTPAAARLFRLLGLHPGPDVATPAAASMVGLPVDAVRPLLAQLAGAHLAAEHVPGRYACHDLLRAYATEQAERLDADAERRAAVRRMLSHYVHTASAGDLLLNPLRDYPPTLPALPGGVLPEQLAGRGEAMAWFAAERPVLLAAIRQRSGLDVDAGFDQDAGFDEDVWQLVWTLRPFLSSQGLWHDSIDALAAALEAAQRLGDPLRQALAHRYLGSAYLRLNRDHDARNHLQDALDLCRRAGDPVGEAQAHRYFSWLLGLQGRHREALSHAEQALDLFRTADHRPGQARALNAVGWFHALLGDHERALHYCQQALDLQQELGDRLGQAETWDSLGYAYRCLGRHARATACYQASVDTYRELDDRYNEADKLVSLGNAYHAAGALLAASSAWRHALSIFDQLGHSEAADNVRAKLSELPGDDAPPSG